MKSPKTTTASAPIFIQKTYTLFEESPAAIASWANNGTTIVIKDPQQFATMMLPKYFKHNNFLSFVRQLNFYGFRKYKKEEVELVNNESTKHWWEFFHDKFLRAKPELMVQIRRKTYSEGDGTDKEEVEELKNQVNSLQNQFQQLTDQISSLTTLVSTLLQTQKRPLDEPETVSVKKQKIENDFDGLFESVSDDVPMPSLDDLFASEEDESTVVNSVLASFDLPLETRCGALLGNACSSSNVPFCCPI
ncbi:HSF-type DNA-binding [Achlya hypogyna]|uniref:HSF-type DNA-binding n=1 Tax=Achlya hypogyna TaxID=1202772 RepID=A0A1V9YQZ0_ACHHY|nr:HSF-type DNA-binding [Achlya hypogyna]